MTSPDRFALVRAQMPQPVGVQVEVVALRPRGHNAILGTTGSGRPPKRAEIRTPDHRLRAIRRMTSRRDAGANRGLSEPLGQIRSARESVKLASRSQGYGCRFGVLIGALARWADQYPGTLIDSVE